MKNAIAALLVSALLVAPTQDASKNQESHQDKSRFKNGAPEMYDFVFDDFASDAETSSVSMLWPYDSINLERTPCLGTCPVYKVTLHRDGSVELHVTNYCSVPNGDWVGEVGIRMFGRLCYALDSIGFQSLAANYTAGWTDDSTCIVTASLGKESKTVSDYGSVAPIGLWMFQGSIDSLVRQVKWRSK